MHMVKIKRGSCGICEKQSTSRTGGNALTKTLAEWGSLRPSYKPLQQIWSVRDLHKVTHMFLALCILLSYFLSMHSSSLAFRLKLEQGKFTQNLKVYVV